MLLLAMVWTSFLMKGTYASCINLAYERTREPFFFLGADDIRFTSGWLDAAMAEMEDSQVCVVGSVDPARNENGDHANHYLIPRSYIDERGGAPDRVGRVLYPYHHAFTDAEFISVAKARNVYQLSSSCFVEHHHPGWTDGGKVSNVDPLFEATYAQGNKYLSKDRRTLRRRSHLWYIDLIERRTPSEADLRWARLVGHPSQSRFRILRKEIYLYGQDWYWRLRVWAKKLKLR
jgi:hypothetical protein